MSIVSCPARDAVRKQCIADAGPRFLFDSTGIPGLQRIIACCAAPGTHAYCRHPFIGHSSFAVA
jgi:hypothetical protein